MSNRIKAGIKKRKIRPFFFLPAERLGIEPVIREALITLLGKLETGQIPYEYLGPSVLKYAPLLIANAPPQTINMGVWRCGTVACIGGWVEHIIGGQVPDNKIPRDLDNLFYATDLEHEVHARIDEVAIARALRNYLTYGSARWPRAIKAARV